MDLTWDLTAQFSYKCYCKTNELMSDLIRVNNSKLWSGWSAERSCESHKLSCCIM